MLQVVPHAAALPHYAHAISCVAVLLQGGPPAGWCAAVPSQHQPLWRCAMAHGTCGSDSPDLLHTTCSPHGAACTRGCPGCTQGEHLSTYQDDYDNYQSLCASAQPWVRELCNRMMCAVILQSVHTSDAQHKQPKALSNLCQCLLNCLWDAYTAGRWRVRCVQCIRPGTSF